MCNSQTEKSTLSIKGLKKGIKMIWLVALAVFPFGLTFGVSAVEKGIDPINSILMSILVFAGTAQFAAIDLWDNHIPLIPLILTMLAINSRNIILGASLYPWIGKLPIYKIAAVTPILTDANWAVSMDAYKNGERDLGVFIGSGLLIWLIWILGTALGVFFTNFIIAPEQYGLDLLMPVFFICVLINMGKQQRFFLPWLTAGITSLITFLCFEGNWYIITGALAGGIAGGIHD